MKQGTMLLICRVLMVSLMLLSFHSVRAGMIGTEQLTAASGTDTDRAAVISIIYRSEVSQQLQALGLEPQIARDRVAAMTDREVQTLSGQLDSLPAGGISHWWIAAIVVAIVVAAVFGWYKT